MLGPADESRVQAPVFIVLLSALNSSAHQLVSAHGCIVVWVIDTTRN